MQLHPLPCLSPPKVEALEHLLKFPVFMVLLSFTLSMDAPSIHYIITLALLVDVFSSFHTSVFIAEVLSLIGFCLMLSCPTLHLPKGYEPHILTTLDEYSTITLALCLLQEPQPP